MENSPVSLREPLEEFADFKVIASHGADQRNQLFAHVLGNGFAVHLDGQVIAALGGIFMQRTLQQVQGLVDLAFELFPAEVREFGWCAHKYTYIYAYFWAVKSARQDLNYEINA